MKPSFVFDNKRHFIDITDERTRIKYQDVEEVGGYRFRHVKYGIFAAAPSFQITKKDMRAILEEYADVYFVVEGEYRYSDPDDKVFRVVFAFSTNHYFCREINFLNHTDDEDIARYRKEGMRYDDVSGGNEGEKPALQPVFERMSGRPWMMLAGHIGIKVEPGIYYFPTNGEQIGACTWSLPVVSTMSRFSEVRLAGICHATDFHPSPDIAVEYLAIGEEYFPRLKKLLEILRDGFYYEFSYGTASEDNDGVVHVLDEEDLKRLLDEPAEYRDLYIPLEEGAEELVEGIGMRDICVHIQRPLFESKGFRTYNAAYRLGEELVLVQKMRGEIKTERHLLRYLSGLYVKEKVILNNGIEYPVIHHVIDLGKDRLKELLTPEAYELYLQERTYIEST